MTTTTAAATDSSGLSAISQLATLLIESPQDYLRPTIEVQQTAIRAAKVLLDSLAADVVNAQNSRTIEGRKKRKRGDEGDDQPSLQVRQVYTKGFDVKQIWEQTKRILDAAHQEVERDIKRHKEISVSNGKSRVSAAQENPSEDGQSEIGTEDEITHEGDGLDDMSDNDDDNETRVTDEIQDDYDDDHTEEGEEDLGPEEDIEAESDVYEESESGRHSRKEIYVQDPNGLNDGFFSIDDFNKQSQFMEQMDARGEEDNPSDEDEIDWDVDPLSMASSKPVNKSKAQLSSKQDMSDEESDEEEGPTFGNADLNMSESDGGDTGEDEEIQDLGGNLGGLSNANEIRYTDFFEPPPKKPSKTKRMRALPKTQPPSKLTEADDSTAQAEEQRLQNDLDRAMADVRRDLLDSDDDDMSEDEDEDGEDASDGNLGRRTSKLKDKNMSTHEKQRAEIAAEIKRLEAANVAKRDWQLSGEARAADRPVNSLIEEDLEFERAGKPIAPVTAETTEEIDALIKRRILAREFDEVVRRVPGSLNLANETRRGRIELDDSKPQASLGEIYEAEYQKNADPLSYTDKRSTAIKKQHAQIEVLWKQVREQLDLLSNMHFKPKRTEIEVKTVEDKPRIMMEDARPVGEIESGEGGMLAPQEVYRPGTDSKRRKDEIMLQGGAAVSREEMSREEKLRRRRREKERTKKSQNNREMKVLGKAQADKKHGKKEKDADKMNIIDDLKRGGVKLVGKGGELQNIGKQKKGRREGGNIVASNLKL